MPISKKKNNIFVLDTFAVFAYLLTERGAAKIQEWMHNAQKGHVKLIFCEMNLGELYYVTWKKFGQQKAEEVLSFVSVLPLEIERINSQFILAAAKWKALYAISYADAFALQTAAKYDVPLITKDAEFNRVKEIEVIQL